MRWQRRARRWETIHEQPDISRPYAKDAQRPYHAPPLHSKRKRARYLRHRDQLGPPRQSEYAQQASKVTFWTTATQPDLTPCRRSSTTSTARTSDVQAELAPKVGGETDTTKLMTAVRGGVGPDVYMLDRFIVAQRASEGVLQDLSEFMARRPSARSTFPSPGRRRHSRVPRLPSPSTPTRALSSTTLACCKRLGSIPPSSISKMVP